MLVATTYRFHRIYRPYPPEVLHEIRNKAWFTTRCVIPGCDGYRSDLYITTTTYINYWAPTLCPKCNKRTFAHREDVALLMRPSVVIRGQYAPDDHTFICNFWRCNMYAIEMRGRRDNGKYKNMEPVQFNNKYSHIQTNTHRYAVLETAREVQRFASFPNDIQYLLLEFVFRKTLRPKPRLLKGTGTKGRKRKAKRAGPSPKRPKLSKPKQCKTKRKAKRTIGALIVKKPNGRKRKAETEKKRVGKMRRVDNAMEI